MHHNRAINSLRGFGSWYNASLRLLSDLVDCADKVDDAAKEFRPQSLKAFVPQANAASFSLFWSLDLAHWPKEIRKGPPLHLVWLCERNGLNAPLEALAHVLARAIADEHGEPAAVATTLDGHKDKVNLTLWRGKRFVKKSSATADHGSIENELGVGIRKGKAPFCHLIFVRPPDGTVPLAKRFHRIVLVTDDPDVRKVPRQIGNLRAILKPEVFKDPEALPYYCAIVPTVVAPAGRPKSTSAHDDSALRRVANAVWSTGRLETEPVADDFEASKPDPYRRLRRDVCRLSLDLDDIAARWTKRKSAKPPVLIKPEDTEGGAAAARWARAVTNRQVGLALSGGGASSYHLVPLIEELVANNVPIDVVGGVSGGALLGAYFCARRQDGLDLAIKHGPQFTWYALASVIDSRAIQYKVDYDLGAVRVEDLTTRFVAITTALSDDARPQGKAVVAGTVGEAVRLSGSAPIEFGRTMSGKTRFTDGASATLIPARVLRDYGADIVFACNSIPGPSTGNPLSGMRSKLWLPLRAATGFLTRYTILGRFVDAWIAAAYLVEQSSRQVEEDASEYAEPKAQPTPLIDSVRFWAAKELAGPRRSGGARARIKSEPGDVTAGDRFLRRWEESKKSPRLREDDQQRHSKGQPQRKRGATR